MALSKVLFLTVVLCLIYVAPARPRVNTCKNGKCASGHGYGIEVTKREEKLEKRALDAEDEFEDLSKRKERNNEFLRLEDKVKALKRSA